LGGSVRSKSSPLRHETSLESTDAFRFVHLFSAIKHTWVLSMTRFLRHNTSLDIIERRSNDRNVKSCHHTGAELQTDSFIHISISFQEMFCSIISTHVSWTQESSSGYRWHDTTIETLNSTLVIDFSNMLSCWFPFSSLHTLCFGFQQITRIWNDWRDTASKCST